jgi:hypothetical protein
MKRLGVALTLFGFCLVIGACDGSRGLTEPADPLRNGGTMGSGHRDGTSGDATTQENGGTIGSGHRKDDGVSTAYNGGMFGSGHGGGVPGDSLIATENIGTIGSGH